MGKRKKKHGFGKKQLPIGKGFFFKKKPQSPVFQREDSGMGKADMVGNIEPTNIMSGYPLKKKRR